MSDGLRLMLASCCDDVCSTPGCYCAERIQAALAAAEARGAERMRDRAAQVVEAQPFYPDTHTGMRQQWVKDQAAAAIRVLPIDGVQA